jgi:hypothetical protein
MDNYSNLFNQHEPDSLLRELNGNILWYWKPMSPNDKRMGCLSNAPFEAVDRIKKLEAALRLLIEWHDDTGVVMLDVLLDVARAALEGVKSDD